MRFYQKDSVQKYSQAASYGRSEAHINFQKVKKPLLTITLNSYLANFKRTLFINRTALATSRGFYSDRAMLNDCKMDNPPPLPALLIDASGQCLATGVLGTKNTWQSYNELNGTALETLFKCIEKTLKDANTELNQIHSFICCVGPGSVLGLRLAVMAVETWARIHFRKAPVYTYNSLNYCATILQFDQIKLGGSILVSDWKKDAWHAVKLLEDQECKLEVIDSETLRTWNGAIFHLPQRKGWQDPPANCTTIKYQPKRIIECIDSGILNYCESIELFSSTVNSYKKWIPKRHGST